MKNAIESWVVTRVVKRLAQNLTQRALSAVAVVLSAPAVHAQVPPTPAGVTAELIYATQFEGRYEMQYLRLSKGTGENKKTAYAIWFPPPVRGVDQPTQGGAVLLTNPYAGIDWTSQPPDVWAYAQAGTTDFTLIPDVYGPGYNPESPTFVAYDYSEYYDSGAFALPFLMNGFGAMIMFERFYAGASLQDNINAALMGLEYIKSQPNISMSKVAVWGSSWGGSLSTYAAAQAPADLKPAIGVACTPILDFQKFVSYGTVLPSVSSDPTRAYYRMEPYVRRVRAAAEKNGVVDYTPYSLPALQAGLTMPFLFLHDSFDSIAPFVHAAPLYYDGAPQRELLLYPHIDSPADWTYFDVGHTPVTPGYDEPTALLFSYTS